MDLREVEHRMKIWFPRDQIDIVVCCYDLHDYECGDNDLDWPCGEYPKFTEEFIEESEDFQWLWGDWRQQAERLWQRGQACVGVVCIGDQKTPSCPSLVVSSTFHAICVRGGTINTAPGPVQLYND